MIRGRLGVLGWLVLIMLASVTIYDGVFIRETTLQTTVGYLITVPAGLVAVTALYKVRLPPPLTIIVPLWAAAAVVYLAVALRNSGNPGNYIIADAVALTAPLLCLLAIMARPALAGRRAVGAILVAFGVSAVIALILNGGLRYDAPSPLLMAGVWLWYARRPGIVPATAVLATLFLSFDSGYRAAVGIWALIGYIAMRSAPRWLRGFLLFGAVAVGVLLIFGVWSPGDTQDTSARVFQLSDASSNQRLAEVQDAWAAFTAWPIWQYPFGAGIGSEFVAIKADVSLNIRNGMLHHIHVGPMTVLYRLGIVGLVVMIFLYRRIFMSAFKNPQADFVRAWFPLAMTGMAVEFLVFNASLFPHFWYTLAGFLYYEYAGEKDSESSWLKARRCSREAATQPSAERSRAFAQGPRAGSHRPGFISQVVHRNLDDVGQ